MWRKRNTLPLLVGMQVGTTTLELNLAVPQKPEHDTCGGPCYTTPRHIPKGFSGMQKGHMSHYVRSSFTYKIARSWKNPRCPSMEEWIHKMWYVYTLEYYSAIKNNEFLSGAIPVLVFLGSIRKQAEQPMGSKPVSNIPHGLCISSCFLTCLSFSPDFLW